MVRSQIVWSDGSPIQPGDEIEVRYPEIHPIPHRGLVSAIVESGLGVVDVQVAHNSKSQGGVCIVSWNQFSQGQPVKLLRRPSSVEHRIAILERARANIGHPYDGAAANCEHFTDYCYSGKPGESPTLQAGIAILAGVGCVFYFASDRE